MVSLGKMSKPPFDDLVFQTFVFIETDKGHSLPMQLVPITLSSSQAIHWVTCSTTAPIGTSTLAAVLQMVPVESIGLQSLHIISISWCVNSVSAWVLVRSFSLKRGFFFYCSCGFLILSPIYSRAHLALQDKSQQHIYTWYFSKQKYHLWSPICIYRSNSSYLHPRS